MADVASPAYTYSDSDDDDAAGDDSNNNKAPSGPTDGEDKMD